VDLFVESPTFATEPISAFHVYAAVSESAEDPATFIECQLQLVPSPNGTSQTAIRANLQVAGLNVGRYIRFAVTFPQDVNDEVLLKAIVWHAPMYQGAP
jgi:hypothetical protein